MTNITTKKAFLLNASARKTAETYNVNSNTVNKYFKIFRENISNNISKKQKKLTGEVEVDEMYYGKTKGTLSVEIIKAKLFFLA